MGQLRVVRIERDVQLHGEGALQRRAVETGYMGRFGVGDGGPDALHQPRTLEDLLRQRQLGGVVATQERQPPTRVTERNARKQVQIIVHDGRGDRLARNEDEVGAGHTQQHQHAQHPLLVVVHSGDLLQFLRVQ
jgi:hypothetical protein